MGKMPKLQEDLGKMPSYNWTSNKARARVNAGFVGCPAKGFLDEQACSRHGPEGSWIYRWPICRRGKERTEEIAAKPERVRLRWLTSPVQLGFLDRVHVPVHLVVGVVIVVPLCPPGQILGADDPWCTRIGALNWLPRTDSSPKLFANSIASFAILGPTPSSNACHPENPFISS